MAAVEAALGALDPTLRAAADAARGRALHQIEALHEKSTRALKKRDQARADRLRRTRDALLPGGVAPGARAGPVGLVARHGEADRRRPARAHRPLGARPPGGLSVNIGITCYPTVGGSGAVATELGKQLARRGHHDPLRLVPAAVPPRRLRTGTSRSTRWTSRPTCSSSTRRTTWPWPPRWPRSRASTSSTSSTCTTRSRTPSRASSRSRCWARARRS